MEIDVAQGARAGEGVGVPGDRIGAYRDHAGAQEDVLALQELDPVPDRGSRHGLGRPSRSAVGRLPDPSRFSGGHQHGATGQRRERVGDARDRRPGHRIAGRAKHPAAARGEVGGRQVQCIGRVVGANPGALLAAQHGGRVQESGAGRSERPGSGDGAFHHLERRDGHGLVELQRLRPVSRGPEDPQRLSRVPGGRRRGNAVERREELHASGGQGGFPRRAVVDAETGSRLSAEPFQEGVGSAQVHAVHERGVVVGDDLVHALVAQVLDGDRGVGLDAQLRAALEVHGVVGGDREVPGDGAVHVEQVAVGPDRAQALGHGAEPGCVQGLAHVGGEHRGHAHGEHSRGALQEGAVHVDLGRARGVEAAARQYAQLPGEVVVGLDEGHPGQPDHAHGQGVVEGAGLVGRHVVLDAEPARIDLAREVGGVARSHAGVAGRGPHQDRSVVVGGRDGGAHEQTLAAVSHRVAAAHDHGVVVGGQSPQGAVGEDHGQRSQAGAARALAEGEDVVDLEDQGALGVPDHEVEGHRGPEDPGGPGAVEDDGVRLGRAGGIGVDLAVLLGGSRLVEGHRSARVQAAVVEEFAELEERREDGVRHALKMGSGAGAGAS